MLMQSRVTPRSVIKSPKPKVRKKLISMAFTSAQRIQWLLPVAPGIDVQPSILSVMLISGCNVRSFTLSLLVFLTIGIR